MPSQPVTTKPNATCYASVVAGAATPSAPIPTPRHAIVIIPAQADAKENREKVTKSLEPALKKAKVSRVQLGERDLLIEFPSVLDISKIRDSAHI